MEDKQLEPVHLFAIDAMSCSKCEAKIAQALLVSDPDLALSIDLENKTAEVVSFLNLTKYYFNHSVSGLSGAHFNITHAAF